MSSTLTIRGFVKMRHVHIFPNGGKPIAVPQEYLIRKQDGSNIMLENGNTVSKENQTS